jgi:hypothetical protein
MEKGEIAILENLEELLPGRLLELLVVLAEIEAKNSAPLPFGPNDRRASPALFGPATDLIVISGRGGLAHGFAPWKLQFCDSTSKIRVRSWQRRSIVPTSPHCARAP